MSNYRRFITYLFLYDHGEKMGACGHARIEQRANQGKIDFYIKDCKADVGEVMPYFFARRGHVRLPIGKLAVKNNCAEGAFRFECARMGGTEYHFSKVQGLMIPLGDEQMIVGQWEGEVFSWEALTGKEAGATEAGAAEEEVTKGEAYNMEMEHTAEVGKQQSTILPSWQDATVLRQSDSVVQQQSVSVLQQQMASPAQELEFNLRALRPKHYPFQGDLSDWATQAQLRDIRLLPQNYWKLANNSFVLRGYFNYGSILIGYMESEKRFFVGVPGVFHKQERMIAGLFGFDRFRGQKSAEGKPGDFGYWYQLLDVV